MQDLATSTGSLSSGGQSISNPCTISAVQLISNGTNAATLAVYNGTSSSGVMICQLSIPASTAAPQIYPFNIPVCADKGVFTALTGTGASFILHYVPT